MVGWSEPWLDLTREGAPVLYILNPHFPNHPPTRNQTLQIITLQDPSDTAHMALRDISNFKHLEEMRAEEAAKQAEASEKDKVGNTIRTNASTEMVIKEFQRQKRVSPVLVSCRVGWSCRVVSCRLSNAHALPDHHIAKSINSRSARRRRRSRRPQQRPRRWRRRRRRRQQPPTASGRGGPRF